MSEKESLNNAFHQYDGLKNAKKPFSGNPELMKQSFDSLIYSQFRNVDFSKQDIATLKKIEEVLTFYKNHSQDFKDYEKDFSEYILEKTNALLAEIKVYLEDEKEKMESLKKEILEDKRFRLQKIQTIVSLSIAGSACLVSAIGAIFGILAYFFK